MQVTKQQKRTHLTDARKFKGLTRDGLAQKVNCTGEHIKSLEYGRVNPSVSLMYRICSVLEKDPEVLFGDIIK